MPPIIALLTDFGNQDHYVGAVKGAILSVCPEGTLVDLGHDLPAHDIAEGAFALAAAYRAFPKGTVFLAVVDPGVGSTRRGVALEANGYRFVGPDNGIFSWVLADDPEARVHRISNEGLVRSPVSPTFHARDVFGPVAAHLAAGIPLPEVGPAVTDPVAFRLEGVVRRGAAEWEATVLHVDRFGNLTTNLREGELATILESIDGDVTDVLVVVEGVALPVARTYADVPEGEPCALLGSSGRLEVAVHRGSAHRLLGAGRGAPVRIRRATTEG